MKLNWRFGGKRSEDELGEELQFHLEQEVRKNLADGMSEDEAWRRARIAFGAMETAKQGCRELRVLPASIPLRYCAANSSSGEAEYAADISCVAA